MELIKEIEGKRDKRGAMIRWGVFVCPVCGAHVEKKLRHGMLAGSCSRSCGFEKKMKDAKNQQVTAKKRQSYHPFYKITPAPEECKGCGYWTGKDGCKFTLVEGYSRMLFLQGRTCKEAGIYTTKKKVGNTKPIVSRREI